MDEPDALDRGVEHALSLVELDRPADALRLVKPLVTQAPDRFELWLILALCCTGVGDVQVAESAARRAITLSPDTYLGYALLAHALLVDARLDDAIDAGWAAVRYGPDESVTHQLLAMALAGSSDETERVESALAADRARALAPDDADSHFVSGFVAQLQETPEQARAAYLKALRIEPDHALARYNLGVLDARRGQPVRALRSFAAALRSKPADEDAVGAVDAIVWAGIGCAFVLDLVATRFAVKAMAMELPTRLGVDLAIAAAVPILAVVALSRAPAVLRTYISRKLWRDGGVLPAMLGLLACSAGMAAAGAFQPPAARWLLGVVAILAVAAILVVTLGVLAAFVSAGPAFRENDFVALVLAPWYVVWFAYALIFSELWLMRALVELVGPVRILGGLACAIVPAAMVLFGSILVERPVHRRLDDAPTVRALVAARVGVLVCALGLVVATFVPRPIALAAMLVDLAVVVAAGIGAWPVHRRIRGAFHARQRP